MATKDKPGQSSERKKTTMEKGRPSLSLSSAPVEVKSHVVSTKPATKQRRISSSGEEETSEIVNIKGTLAMIQETLKKLVTKEDIKDLVRSVIVEVKEEVKNEMKEEIKEEIMKDLLQDLNTEINQDLESYKTQHDEHLSKMRQQLSDKMDSLMMDNDTNMENISQLKSRIQKLENQLKQTNDLASSAISMANFNQQYSQKNNIKILNWPEHDHQNLKEEFRTLVYEKAGVNLDGRDILAIHRIPAINKNHPRPVIVKFINSEVRRSVITKREKLKDTFTMVDHITQMNAQLLRKLRSEEREHLVESAWYFNGHIFVLDKRGKRHKMEVTDDIDKKLRV